MDVSKNLKRKNGSLLKKRGEFYSISATVHPRVIIQINNVKYRTKLEVHDKTINKNYYNR